MYEIAIIGAVSIAAWLFNIPMGYLRSKTRKFSLPWFLAIHLAIPLIFFLRVKAGLGYDFIPELVLFAISGQILGGKLNEMIS